MKLVIMHTRNMCNLQVRNFWNKNRSKTKSHTLFESLHY